jgi:lipoate-protein ligase B
MQFRPKKMGVWVKEQISKLVDLDTELSHLLTLHKVPINLG